MINWVAWMGLILGLFNLGVTLRYRVPIWRDENERIREKKDEEKLRRLLNKVLPPNLLPPPEDEYYQ